MTITASSYLNRPDVIIFFAQVLLLFVVVIGSLINLTFFQQNKDLWQMLLTSSLGYMLPNPQFKLGKATLDSGVDMNRTGATPEVFFRDPSKRPSVATTK